MSEVELELARLVSRLRTGSPARWARPGVGALITSLCSELVQLAVSCGDLVPAGIVPDEVRPHGYGDVVATLGYDFLALSPPPPALAAALAALRTTRAALP